jgi:hypothetical protein
MDFGRTPLVLAPGLTRGWADAGLCSEFAGELARKRRKQPSIFIGACWKGRGEVAIRACIERALPSVADASRQGVVAEIGQPTTDRGYIF